MPTLIRTSNTLIAARDTIHGSQNTRRRHHPSFPRSLGRIIHGGQSNQSKWIGLRAWRIPAIHPREILLEARVATFEVSYRVDWKSLSRFSLRGLIQTPPISSTVNRDEAIRSIFKIIWFFFGNYYRYREAFSIKLMLHRCNCNYLYNYNGISRYIRYRLVVLVLKLIGSGIFHTFRWTPNH